MRGDSHYIRLVPLTKWKRLQRLSETTVWQVRPFEVRLVRRQIVPHLRSSCTESSVTELGACASDWREAYECQPSAVCLGERFLECAETTPGGRGWWPWLDALPHWKPVQLECSGELYTAIGKVTANLTHVESAASATLILCLFYQSDSVA